MHDALETHWHNPSSIHRPGQKARRDLDLAREDLAALIGADAREIVFTSGGTEADNFAMLGAFAAQPDRRVIVTSKLEHSAIRAGAARIEGLGGETVWLPCNQSGLVDLDALDAVLRDRASEIALVTLMLTNNETGVMQPIAEIGERCRAHEVLFHTDAVQAVGKVPVDFASLPIDLLSLSGHKFHGPKGAGALVVRRGVRLAAHSLGGGQERDRRGGTENCPGIAGLGAAARGAAAWLATDEAARLGALRDRFESTLVERVGAVVNGVDAPRIWNTANVGFPRLEAEAILLMLSERGVCAAAGSACSSGSLDPSPILLAMGIERAIAHGSVRFSLSRETTEAEVDEALDIIIDVVTTLRASSSAVV